MSAAHRPAFDLESYEDKTLPEGVQLFDLDDLIGHAIKAVIDCPNGEKQCHIVFVTETDCWLALGADTDGYGEDLSVSINVCGDHWNKKIQTLSQYLSVQDMRFANLATPAQLAGLQIIEDARKAKEKSDQADRLRKRLIELEGGTA